MPIDFSSLKDNTGKVAADGAIHTLGAAQVIAISDAAGAGVAITAGAFTSIANAMAYSYTDFADTFSTNQTAEVTNYLDAGDRIDFNFTLTNGNSRVRAQDFGVSVVYLCR